MQSKYFKIQVIATGSAGNSYLLGLADGKSIAIECGVRPIIFTKKTGGSEFFWYSHEHLDHAKYKNEYWCMCEEVSFENEFKLEHGTQKKPCENKGFFFDEANERFLFATDFYGFEHVPVKKSSAGIALVECSHSFSKYKEFSESEDYILRQKAVQWENHACELQTINILQHFYENSFSGKIILIHRSEACMDTCAEDEKKIREYFPIAEVFWAHNLII